MLISALLVRLAMIAVAAFASLFAARIAVETVEARSVVAVQEELLDQSHEWVSVLGDGLQVILEGEAPDEASRFRAIDNMGVKASEQLAPPDFAIEILRNDSGVSLIGLIPASTDRDGLAARITSIADGQPVTDLLEVADYPVPATWNDSVNYALRALTMLPRSKISVTARRVSVNAISDSIEAKRNLETRLARNTPDDVALAVAITAPRPVISPFTTRFVLDDQGARFLACAVDTADAERAVLQAATDAGFEGKSNCVQALGAPSRTWGDAVALSIAAVGEIGGGTVTISDTDVTLQAPMGTGQATFDTAIGRLENALPGKLCQSEIWRQRRQDGHAGRRRLAKRLGCACSGWDRDLIYLVEWGGDGGT